MLRLRLIWICGADPLVRAGVLVPHSAQRYQSLAGPQEADGGVGRGPGGPPHNLRGTITAFQKYAALAWKAALRRDGEQEIRLGEQAAQFGDHGLIARGEWRNHHVELVDAGRDQAGECDDGVEPADAYAAFLGTGEGSRGRHQGRGDRKSTRLNSSH